MTTITPAEEHALYYYELGVAITQWAHVEASLLRLFMIFIKADPERASVTFNAVENFRSKLQLVDRLSQTCLQEPSHLKQWVSLHKITIDLSKKRNRLVHWPTIAFPDNTEGRRYALVPNWIPPSEGIKQKQRLPPGSICLRDINEIRFAFFALHVKLDSFVDHVQGRSRRLPESLSQPMSPLSLRVLRDQIRAKLQVREKPSSK